jgi:hypothetical protein
MLEGEAQLIPSERQKFKSGVYMQKSSRDSCGNPKQKSNDRISAKNPGKNNPQRHQLAINDQSLCCDKT